MSAPFRVLFIATALDLWESSSVERLDLLSLDMRHSELQGHQWMVTVQGHTPQAEKVEDRLLPRLKLGLQPPNFDFTRLRQDLIDADTEGRTRLLKGLHEKLYHELQPGMRRFISGLEFLMSVIVFSTS